MSRSVIAHKLVVLDRDGVINRDSPEFVKSPDEWLPIDGSIDAITRLSRAGFTVVISSNQSGVARGLFAYADLEAMHAKMQRLVSDAGGRISAIFICPHGPDDGCACRKPAPGMLRKASKYFRAGISDVPVIGDSLRDLEAAAAVSARPILVRTGNGRKTLAKLAGDLRSVAVFDDLAAAATALIEE